MKIVIFIFSFLLFSIPISAQEIAVKTKTFYWGNSESYFFKQLTESGKRLLDSTFKIVEVDSINCIRLTSDDELKYTSKDYLKNHRYYYITMYNYNGIISIRRYENKSVASLNQKKKVLLRYSKDDNNQIDKITLYVID